MRETRGLGRFAAFDARDIQRAAETLARYRLTTLGSTQQIDRGARRTFLSGLRDLGRKDSPET